MAAGADKPGGPVHRPADGCDHVDQRERPLSVLLIEKTEGKALPAGRRQGVRILGQTELHEPCRVADAEDRTKDPTTPASGTAEQTVSTCTSPGEVSTCHALRAASSR